jgi:hypothetical protein
MGAPFPAALAGPSSSAGDSSAVAGGGGSFGRSSSSSSGNGSSGSSSSISSSSSSSSSGGGSGAAFNSAFLTPDLQVVLASLVDRAFAGGAAAQQGKNVFRVWAEAVSAAAFAAAELMESHWGTALLPSAGVKELSGDAAALCCALRKAGVVPGLAESGPEANPFTANASLLATSLQAAAAGPAAAAAPAAPAVMAFPAATAGEVESASPSSTPASPWAAPQVAPVAAPLAVHAEGPVALAVATIASLMRAKRAPEASDNYPPSAKRRKTCKLKGVSFHVRDKVYFARLTVDGATRNLGRYETEQKAALAYDLAMLSLRARSELVGSLNFPDDEREQLVEELRMGGWKMPATKAEKATVRSALPAPEEDHTKEKNKKKKVEKKGKRDPQ